MPFFLHFNVSEIGRHLTIEVCILGGIFSLNNCYPVDGAQAIHGIFEVGKQGSNHLQLASHHACVEGKVWVIVLACQQTLI